MYWFVCVTGIVIIVYIHVIMRYNYRFGIVELEMFTM